jgi:hypothetical protein
MDDSDEDVFRQSFEELAADLYGPQDPGELAGDWERFRQERLPAVIAEACALPDDGAGADHVIHAMMHWLTEEAFRDALRSSGRHASAFRVGPDGKLREVWFQKGK